MSALSPADIWQVMVVVVVVKFFNKNFVRRKVDNANMMTSVAASVRPLPTRLNNHTQLAILQIN